MTKEQEINQMIEREYIEYNKAVYAGDKLPKDLMVRFRAALFNTPPANHRMSTDVLKVIANKKTTELTNYEVGFVLNTISGVPLSDLYKDLEEAFEKNKEIEMLKISYNIMVKNVEEQMNQKRATLLNLSGANNLKLAQA